MECLLYVMYVSVCFICINFSALQNAPGGAATIIFFHLEVKVKAW